VETVTGGNPPLGQREIRSVVVVALFVGCWDSHKTIKWVQLATGEAGANRAGIVGLPESYGARILPGRFVSTPVGRPEENGCDWAYET